MSASQPLRVVEHDTDESVGPEYQVPRTEELMKFEGQPVHFTAATLKSATKMEISDAILKMDQKVVFVVEARVQSVDHKVDDNTGKMTRLHNCKVIDSFVVGTDFETLRSSGL